MCSLAPHGQVQTFPCLVTWGVVMWRRQARCGMREGKLEQERTCSSGLVPFARPSHTCIHNPPRSLHAHTYNLDLHMYTHEHETFTCGHIRTPDLHVRAHAYTGPSYTHADVNTGPTHTHKHTLTVAEALPPWGDWCDGLAVLCVGRRPDRMTSVAPGGPKAELLGVSNIHFPGPTGEWGDFANKVNFPCNCSFSQKAPNFIFQLFLRKKILFSSLR